MIIKMVALTYLERYLGDRGREGGHKRRMRFDEREERNLKIFKWNSGENQSNIVLHNIVYIILQSKLVLQSNTVFPFSLHRAYARV